jgi:uncharacterized protein GlcG (DUF336 family)
VWETLIGKAVNGKVIGAIGVSGGTGSQDNLLSLVGVNSLK